MDEMWTRAAFLAKRLILFHHARLAPLSIFFVASQTRYVIQ
jgi:hypothetical protein